jgi:hypothetical protein
MRRATPARMRVRQPTRAPGDAPARTNVLALNERAEFSSMRANTHGAPRRVLPIGYQTVTDRSVATAAEALWAADFFPRALRARLAENQSGAIVCARDAACAVAALTTRASTAVGSAFAGRRTSRTRGATGARRATDTRGATSPRGTTRTRASRASGRRAAATSAGSRGTRAARTTAPARATVGVARPRRAARIGGTTRATSSAAGSGSAASTGSGSRAPARSGAVFRRSASGRDDCNREPSRERAPANHDDTMVDQPSRCRQRRRKLFAH